MGLPHTKFIFDSLVAFSEARLASRTKTFEAGLVTGCANYVAARHIV